MDRRYKVVAVADVIMPSTPKSRHFLDGKLIQEIHSVAIVELRDEPGVYLIYLDDRGVELTDTYHESIEAA
jgi:hypothetical protein